MSNEAPAMTYDSLIQNIIAYSERNDNDGAFTFINNVPTFVFLAEKKIAADFKTLWQLNSATTDVAANTGAIGAPITLPARWRKMVSVGVQGVVTLTERTKEYIDLVNVKFPASTPEHWALWDYNNITIAPLSTTKITLQMIYWEQATPLSPDRQENLITREAPQLLLAGSLLQAAYFLKDAEKMQYWQQMYQDATQALKAEDAARVLDRNTTPVQGA